MVLPINDVSLHEKGHAKLQRIVITCEKLLQFLILFNICPRKTQRKRLTFSRNVR